MLGSSTSQDFVGRIITSAALLTMLAACGSGRLAGTKQAEDVESIYPAEAENSYARALGYMDAGDDTRAIQELEKLLAAYPEYAGPSVNLGIIHGRNGRPDAAEEALRRAVMVCSSCASAHNQLGILQREQGRFAEAEQSYLNAIAADPEYALAYFNLAVLYDLYQGRSELALRYYQDYLKRKPDADGDDVVNKWIMDLQRRIDKPERAAGVRESS